MRKNNTPFLYFSNILYLWYQQVIFLQNPSCTLVGVAAEYRDFFDSGLALTSTQDATIIFAPSCPWTRMTFLSRLRTQVPCACAQPVALDTWDTTSHSVLTSPHCATFLSGTQNRQPWWLSIASAELNWKFSHKVSSLYGSRLGFKLTEVYMRHRRQKEAVAKALRDDKNARGFWSPPHLLVQFGGLGSTWDHGFSNPMHFCLSFPQSHIAWR